MQDIPGALCIYCPIGFRLYEGPCVFSVHAVLLTLFFLHEIPQLAISIFIMLKFCISSLMRHQKCTFCQNQNYKF